MDIDDDDNDVMSSLRLFTVQAYMLVLCATWRTARHVYDLLSQMEPQYNATRPQPVLLYGASGDRDVEVNSIHEKHYM